MNRVTLGLSLAAVALLIVANTCENSRLRRQVALRAADSVAAQHSQTLDSAAALHLADTRRLRRTVDSLAARRQQVRVVTVARTDTLRAELPDSLRPLLDSVIVGYETQRRQDSLAIVVLTAHGQRSDSLLLAALANRDEWRIQAERWRKEATRWRLKLGPFTVRPVVGYGVTPQGAQVFAGVALSP